MCSTIFIFKLWFLRIIISFAVASSMHLSKFTCLVMIVTSVCNVIHQFVCTVYVTDVYRVLACVVVLSV